MVDNVQESSLTRIHNKVKSFDVGAITAFRGDRSNTINRQLNKEILAYLLHKGYSVTKVQGSYIENKDSENEREVSEESFFVADHKESGLLRQDLIKLGIKYDQDSIFFAPKGKAGYLYGTSSRDDAFPDFHATFQVGNPVYGKTNSEFFSRVKGRKFAFESSVDVALKTNNSRFMASKISQTIQEDLDAILIDLD